MPIEVDGKSLETDEEGYLANLNDWVPGVAEVMSKNKDKIKGTVKFIFQPAEEGPPPGEEGGALLMVKEGVMQSPKVDAIFGLHINSQTPVGTIRYKSGGTMAAAQSFQSR